MICGEVLGKLNFGLAKLFEIEINFFLKQKIDPLHLSLQLFTVFYYTYLFRDKSALSFGSFRRHNSNN